LSTPTYDVTLTPAADRDLDDIHGNIAERTSVEQADELIDALIDRAEALAMFPERGSVPPELDAVGKRQYRQVVHSPYRIIYRRLGDTVFVYLIADGRRDMRTLLRHRLHSA
jgi:toxin ParE1/3/4